jgi:hypothetical protein
VILKKTYYNRDNKATQIMLVQRMEENKIPKTALYMNLETRPRGRPRNRWQDEVREGGRIIGGEEWQAKEWKKLLRTARNRHILHTPME